jgi:dienelactone hydrolase
MPRLLRLLYALLAGLIALPAAAQQTREGVVRIPASGTSLVATVMRPAGDDKRPLVVINHGSPPDAASRPTMSPPRFAALSSWFVERGYVVVLPQRRGYGRTGGAWAETYGSCEEPDYYSGGLEGAADIAATIAFMRQQPFVAANRTLVVGESAGGWATIALSSLNPRGVAGMVNLAGGRGGHQELSSGGIGNCRPSALVTAAGRYGATARVPMLWIYAENDSFFSPVLARRMFGAYVAAGGHASLRLLPPLDVDGHLLVANERTVATWSAALADFLATLK